MHGVVMKRSRLTKYFSASEGMILLLFRKNPTPMMRKIDVILYKIVAITALYHCVKEKSSGSVMILLNFLKLSP